MPKNITFRCKDKDDGLGWRKHFSLIQGTKPMSQPTNNTPVSKVRTWSIVQAIVPSLIALAVTIALLRWAGRRWWCACGTITPFSTDAWGPHNSQHLFDPYSLTHALHGVFFCGVFALLFPTMSLRWRFHWAVILECGWEILENSHFVIERYRSATASLGYTGDSIVNSFGDIVSCAAGFCLARWLGWFWAIVIYVFVELILLVLIRDNLTLNVIMLVHPMPAIRNWQSGM